MRAIRSGLVGVPRNVLSKFGCLAPRGLEKWQEVDDLSRATSILRFGNLNFLDFGICCIFGIFFFVLF